MAEIEEGLWGMEVFECMSPRVSYRFLQRVKRRGPEDGASRTERWPPSPAELAVGGPLREKSAKPIHRGQRPKQIAGAHVHIGRHHTGQIAGVSNGDIVVFGRREIVELAFQADQRLWK